MLPQTDTSTGAFALAPSVADDAAARNKSAPRQLAALLAFGRRTTAQPGTQVLCQDAMTLALAVLNADMGSVAEVTEDGLSLEVRLFRPGASGPVTAAGTYQASLDATGSLPAFALGAALPVVADHRTERRFSDPALQALGVTLSLCCPMPAGDRPFGALSVHRRSAGEFSGDEVHFLETLCHMLGVAVAQAQAEQRSKVERALAQGVLASVDELVVILSPEGSIARIGPAIPRMCGVPAADLKGQSFFSALAAPDDGQALRGTIRGVLADHRKRTCAGTLRTKDGHPRQLEWTFTAVVGTEHAVRWLIARGRDVAAGDAHRSEAPEGAHDEDEKGRLLRSSPRVAYQYNQWIAPKVPGRPLTLDSFYEIQCRDISAGGIAFYLPHPPEFMELVVGLGRKPDLALFTARVARVVEESSPAGKRFLVGCSFTGRLQFPLR